MNIIINPINNNKLSLYSYSGKQLLKQYIKLYLNGGTRRRGTSKKINRNFHKSKSRSFISNRNKSMLKNTRLQTISEHRYKKIQKLIKKKNKQILNKLKKIIDPIDKSYHNKLKDKATLIANRFEHQTTFYSVGAIQKSFKLFKDNISTDPIKAIIFLTIGCLLISMQMPKIMTVYNKFTNNDQETQIDNSLDINNSLDLFLKKNKEIEENIEIQSKEMYMRPDITGDYLDIVDKNIHDAFGF